MKVIESLKYLKIQNKIINMTILFFYFMELPKNMLREENGHD
jgi:hypothetical protein